MRLLPIDIEFALVTQRHRTPSPATSALIGLIRDVAANRATPVREVGPRRMVLDEFERVTVTR